jgi:uncharacterized protein YacL
MPANPLTDPNWANEVTDQITSLVGTVRDKTTNNAIVAVRAVVFGLLGLILGLVLVTLLLVFLTRLIQAILSNWIDWDTSVYVSYFIIGGLLTLTGAFLMTKRHS